MRQKFFHRKIESRHSSTLRVCIMDLLTSEHISHRQWRTEGAGFGVFKPPEIPKF